MPIRRRGQIFALAALANIFVGTANIFSFETRPQLFSLCTSVSLSHKDQLQIQPQITIQIQIYKYTHKYADTNTQIQKLILNICIFKVTASIQVKLPATWPRAPLSPILSATLDLDKSQKYICTYVVCTICTYQDANTQIHKCF